MEAKAQPQPYPYPPCPECERRCDLVTAAGAIYVCAFCGGISVIDGKELRPAGLADYDKITAPVASALRRAIPDLHLAKAGRASHS